MSADNGVLEKIISEKLHMDKETLLAEINRLEADDSDKVVRTLACESYVVFKKYRVYYVLEDSSPYIIGVIKDNEAAKRDSDALNNKNNIFNSVGNLIKLICSP